MPRRSKNIWEESFTWVIVAMIPAFVAVVWTYEYVLAWFTSQPTWAQVIEVLGVIATITAAFTLFFRNRNR